MLLVLSELVADVGHGRGRTTVVVDNIRHMLLHQVAWVSTTWRRWDMERFDALLKRGTDTATHLLWCIHVVGLDGSTETILSSTDRDLGRAE